MPAPDGPSYGKLVGGAAGTLVGIPLSIIVARILGFEMPALFDGNTLDAVKGLVQGGFSLAGIYYAPHNFGGGA